MAALWSLRVATFLSRRAIVRGNRGIVLLTVAMMAVIYAELMFVPSLIQGATNEIQQELREYVTASIAITPSHSDRPIPAAGDGPGPARHRYRRGRHAPRVNVRIVTAERPRRRSSARDALRWSHPCF